MSKFFATIKKMDENDDGTIEVHGVASSEAVDSQGETVTKACMEAAIPEFFKHGGTGPLRAMHQPIAAGYVYKAEVNAEGQTEISAKVVDPVEVLKCKTGVYKGFSIGGKKEPGGYDSETKTITKMKLTEISLVDRPANPEAVITMWKGEDMGTTNTTQAEAVDALAAIINKGDITPAMLLELATAQIAKGKEATAAPGSDTTQGDEVKPAATVPGGAEAIAEDKKKLAAAAALTSSSTNDADENKTAVEKAIAQKLKEEEAAKLAKAADSDVAAREAAIAKKKAEDAAAAAQRGIAKKGDESKDGDVAYADEKNKKYPIDTEEHIRAAWSYINKEKDAAEYDAAELKTIKGKIIAAWKKEIDKDGPPSAEKDDKAKKATETGDVKKGLYGVACFADLLDQLGWAAQSSQCEANWEGDDSPIPAQLRDWLKSGADILLAMAKEEIDELMESLAPEDNGSVDVIMMSAKVGEIQKAFSEPGLSVAKAFTLASSYLTDEEITKAVTFKSGEEPNIIAKLKDSAIVKAGARNSAADKKSIQDIHDSSMALGAVCGDASEKHDHTGDIKKVQDQMQDIIKICKEAGAADDVVLSEFINKLAATNKELVTKVAEFEKLPKPSKAILKSVSKETDLDDNSTKQDTGPVLKQDGTIDQEATFKRDVNKVYQAGPSIIKR